MTVSRACRQGHVGCDLNSVNETEITPHEAEFRGEGNRLLPVTGRGEGVRPHEPTGEGFPQEINAVESSANPVPVNPSTRRNTFVTFGLC